MNDIEINELKCQVPVRGKTTIDVIRDQFGVVRTIAENGRPIFFAKRFAQRHGIDWRKEDL